MAKIQRKVLTLLEALYRFTSSQDGAPSEFQLGLGIQGVHDLSRMSEFGAAKIVRASAGYWLASCTNTHVAVGDIEQILNIAAPAVPSEGYLFTERDDWAWYVDSWITANDPTDFQAANILLDNITNDFFVGPSIGVPNSVERLMYRATAIIAEGSLTRGGLGVNTLPLTNPVLILSPQDGIRFESRSDTAGTVTINFNVLLWIGQRGTMPPGMS